MAFLPTEALDLLQRAHTAGRLGHAYLFIDPNQDGAAVWRLAIELVKLVNNLPPRAEADAVLAHPDVHLAEPESKSRRIVIEQIREMESALRLRAASVADNDNVGSLFGEADGGVARTRKVAILRDADRLQPQAANAFLKTLEEPPDHSLLLLLTAQPEAMLDTILSRCIRVTLRAEGRSGGGAVAAREDEAALLSAFRAHAKTGTASLPAAYRLLRTFQECLAAARARLVEEADAALDADEKRYGQTTDSGKAFLDDREAALKAQTEARYVAERARLLDVIARWWGDALREASASGSGSTDRILHKLARLDDLRANLERPVQEALALEVAFLRVFGE